MLKFLNENNANVVRHENAKLLLGNKTGLSVIHSFTSIFLVG